MPAEKLDPGGNADILIFKEIIKKDDFSRLEQTRSMIIFIKRAGETAPAYQLHFFRSSAFVKMVALERFPIRWNHLIEKELLRFKSWSMF